MRLIAGRFGGRRLVAPAGRDTRPTGDRVREALFSILAAPGASPERALAGLRVLDLFAGSGALGLEALSRGAAAATFVERSPRAVAALRRNLAALGVEAEVAQRDVTAFLQSARREGAEYDLVFLDPPYRAAAGLGRVLSLEPVLAPGARVVVESDRRAPMPLAIPLADERRYGDTLIRIHALP